LRQEGNGGDGRTRGDRIGYLKRGREGEGEMGKRGKRGSWGNSALVVQRSEIR